MKTLWKPFKQFENHVFTTQQRLLIFWLVKGMCWAFSLRNSFSIFENFLFDWWIWTFISWSDLRWPVALRRTTKESRGSTILTIFILLQQSLSYFSLPPLTTASMLKCYHEIARIETAIFSTRLACKKPTMMADFRNQRGFCTDVDIFTKMGQPRRYQRCGKNRCCHFFYRITL